MRCFTAILSWAVICRGLEIRELKRATEVKDLGKTLPKGTALMMKYYTPWCSHCQTLEPALRAAAQAVEDWDAEDVFKTVFAQMDCEENGADCKKLGVRAFPTIKFYNNEGNAYLEYPKLPRSADSLTAFLARYRRIIRPYPISLRDVFTARTCSPGMKFKDSICRGFRIENYLVGGKEVFEQFNKLFKNAPSAFLEFIDHGKRAEEICLVDRFTGENRYCVDAFDPKDARVVGLMKDAILAHRHPRVIENASWFDFFNLRDADSKKYLVVIPDSSFREDEVKIREIAENQNRDFSFLTVTGDTLRVFDQAGVAAGALVLPSNVYDKSFFHLAPDRLEDLDHWLGAISEEKIPRQFPPGSRSSTQEFRDSAISMIEFVRHGFSQLSPRRKIQIFLTAIALGLAWIYLVRPVKEPENAETVVAQAPAKPKFFKRAKGVCLVNGKQVRVVKRSSE